jgi:HPt (histidine-containing phosphotransfer) domain-containing protein
MSDRITVEVDEALRDLIPGFVAHKREEAGQARDAAARGDYETVAKIAHRIKGEGAGYGFKLMTDLGSALEAAAKGGDGGTATALAHRLLAYLEGAEIVFRPSED